MGRPVPINLSSAEAISAGSAYRKFVSLVLLLALRDGAGQVRFEPERGTCKPTCRGPGWHRDLIPAPILTFRVVCEVMAWARLGILYHPWAVLRRHLAWRRGTGVPPLEGRVRLLLGGVSVDGSVSVEYLNNGEPIDHSALCFHIPGPTPASERAGAVLEEYLRNRP